MKDEMLHPNQRWVIVLTLPSGNKYVCADRNGKLALVPMVSDKKLEQVMAWEKSEGAKIWLTAFLSKMTEFQRIEFLKFNPQLGVISVS